MCGMCDAIGMHVVDILTTMATIQLGRRGPGAVPVQQWDMPFIAQLLRDMPVLLTQDLAASTQRNYASQEAQFAAFCGKVGVAVEPRPELVATFILGRMRQGYKLFSIEGGLAAIERMAARMGLGSVRDAGIVQQAIRVLRQHADRGSVQKLPLSQEHLVAIIAQLAVGPVRTLFHRTRDTAMLQLGWAGMLRGQELVDIRWEEVQLVQGGVMVFIPHSKTDRGGCQSP